jgi:dihydroorotate dehydrogenase
MIGFALQTYQCEPSQNVKVISKYDKHVHMESSNISMPNVEELLQCQSIKERELDVLKVIAKDKKLKVI